MVYVSQWQPFPLPVRGQHNPGTLLERIQVHLTLPILLLGFPRLTTVLHCRWGEGGHSCTPATEESFVAANGMTMNADGSTVFVNDFVEKLITVMAREEVRWSSRLAYFLTRPPTTNFFTDSASQFPLIQNNLLDLLSTKVSGFTVVFFALLGHFRS